MCQDRRVQRVSERRLYEGYRRIDERTYALPGGGTASFEIKLEEATAVILALTPALEVVLVREFRPGVEEWLLELPGGHLDDGEAPLEAARRELLEETGYAAAELRAVGSMLDCAYSTRVRHVFAAERCTRLQEPHADEHSTVVLLSLPAFREHLRSGRLTDVGPAYRALDALNLL